jgi:thioredoxin reductase (NADPH)
MDSYDIVIVGGGLAGLTAALVAARHGRSTLALLAEAPGGHLINVGKIEDFPGFPGGIAGYELCPSVQEQAADAGAEFRLAEVRRLERRGDDWRVVADDGEVNAGAVVVATGSRPRELGVPGEARLAGRGVSHCASCDGPLLRGRPAGVVGGGDSALQEALTLAEHTASVTIFHRGAAFSAQQTFQRRAAERPAIGVRFNTVVEEVVGDDALAGALVRDTLTGATERVELAGLFVYIGLEPNTTLLAGLTPLDADGRVPTDLWMRTTLPGLFAAGDLRRDSAAQAITTAGDGATAAVAAHRYLADRAWPA